MRSGALAVAAIVAAVMANPTALDAQVLLDIVINGPPLLVETESAQFTATARFDVGTLDITPYAVWSVAPDTYASVAHGLLTARPVPGNQTITLSAQYTGCGGTTVSTSAQVTIIEGPYFRRLGGLPNAAPPFLSQVYGMSPDGAVVLGAGWHSVNGMPIDQAFRWSLTEGLVGMPTLAGWSGSSTVDASENANVILGRVEADSGRAGAAFVWTPGDGMMQVGPWPDVSYRMDAYAISADGGTVVGQTQSQTSDRIGWKWTTATGFVGLGSALPEDISADGSVIVGRDSARAGTAVYLWTAQDGYAYPNICNGCQASVGALSLDGNSFVGTLSLPNGQHSPVARAYRWNVLSGTTMLGALSEEDESWSSDLSRNAEIIVGGNSSSTFGVTATVWDRVHGMRDLRTVLASDASIVLDGWRLYTAIAVSADGQTISGQGINALGEREGWVAHMPCWIAGDFDNNIAADGEDIRPFIDCLFQTAGANANCWCADMNRDGAVDTADYALFVYRLLNP